MMSVPAAIRRTFFVCATLLLTAGVSLSQTTVVEVIPLRYRTAHEVIPVLQPMLAPGGGISGLQGQLIVRTTPVNLEEIRRILAAIDSAPRQLLITVRQDSGLDRGRLAAEVSGSVGGEHGRVTIPGSRDRGGGNLVLREGDDRLRAQVAEGRTLATERNTHSVRVMEGREAYIRMGQSVPVRERQVQRVVVGGQVVDQVVDTTQYRDVTTGFYVLPRVSGDRVTLDVRPQRESLARDVPGAVNVQSMVTTLSGRIGEWIEIGGITQNVAGQQSVLLGAAATSSRDSRRVLVRVEEAR